MPAEGVWRDVIIAQPSTPGSIKHEDCFRQDSVVSGCAIFRAVCIKYCVSLAADQDSSPKMMASRDGARSTAEKHLKSRHSQQAALFSSVLVTWEEYAFGTRCMAMSPEDQVMAQPS